MAGHTPGPWELDFDDGEGHVIRMGPHIKERAIYQSQHHVDWNHYIDPEDDPEAFEEAEANARLMTAAPDLLAALQEMVANLLSHARFGLNDDEVAMLKRAEAAITKATT